MPDPIRGEFVNIASIVGSDETDEWMIRPLAQEGRARQFAGVDALAAAHSFVLQVEEAIDLQGWLADSGLLEEEDLPKPSFVISEQWLATLAASFRHVVQLSPPSPVLANSLEEAAERIHPRIVWEQEARRYGYLTKHRLFSDLTRRYLLAGLDIGSINKRAIVTASGPKSFSHQVDFVISNGLAVQLAQTWSFQVTTQGTLARDVKAWGWTMRELKEHGGRARAEARTIAVPANVIIEVVLAKPEQAQTTATYDEALGVFEELGVRVRLHGDETAVAADAVQLLKG